MCAPIIMQKHQDPAMGMRVKVACLMTTVGTVGPVFLSVTGLTERELSVHQCKSGFLNLEFDDLCDGGGGLLSAEQGPKGYVMLIRNEGDKNTDKAKFEAYRDKVLLPFVAKIRAKNGDSAINDGARFVAWCYGDLAQLATTVDEATVNQYKELNITSNKQSVAKSATEQAA